MYSNIIYRAILFTAILCTAILYTAGLHFHLIAEFLSVPGKLFNIVLMFYIAQIAIVSIILFSI